MSISIIIPFKNNIEYLEETLTCLIHQTKRADEIIVVNDHCAEHLDRLIQKFESEVIFINSEGNGACDARNTGFRASTGKFVKFFDSDDVLTKNGIEVQYNRLKESNSGLIYGPVVKVAREDSSWKQLDAIMYYHRYPSNQPFDKIVIRGFSCMFPQLLIRREVFTDAGLWESGLKSRQDIEFLFRIAQVEQNPIHENKSCIFYRQHNNQITQGGNSREQLANDLNHVLVKISESINNSKYSFSDRFYVKSRIVSNLKNCSSQVIDEVIKEKKIGVISKIIGSNYLRIENKIERVITQSKWSQDIGICNDKSIFEKYLDNL